jgi:hypothetical protein
MVDDLDEQEPCRGDSSDGPSSGAPSGYVSIERRQHETEAELQNQCIADVLIDVHDVIHQPVAFAKRHVSRVGDVPVGAVDHELRTQPVAEHRDMGHEHDLHEHRQRVSHSLPTKT